MKNLHDEQILKDCFEITTTTKKLKYFLFDDVLLNKVPTFILTPGPSPSPLGLTY